ncbi:hypothetical protein [Maledivibacter halophilus]|uniref:hypothetical protein n=1 Tax=Maledivibacter halophilus TaxID=36842 RepID=UPI001116C6C7|nr:hypothetical protein [Maledivibacter halophilus]
MWLIICGALFFTGCVNANEKADSSQETNKSGNSVEKNSTVESKDNKKSEAAKQKGQRDQNRPDMFGKVKSIIGNEVILELAEIPQRQKDEGNGKGEDKSPIAVNNVGIDSRPDQRPQGGAGGRQLKFTGETATIMIPVGVPITIRSSGEIKNLEIADIYEGSMLQIWIDEEENINKVMMMQGR